MVTLFVSWEIPPVLVDPSSLPLKKKKKKKIKPEQRITADSLFKRNSK